jgi:thymidylate synthase (FAD)
MTEIRWRSDFEVDLIDKMGSDHRIVQAAKVSTLGAESLEAGESSGLIRYLMRNRHGSPFEHATMQWMISAPIFVWREFHRHRIASYNEESSRYKQLEPIFYAPDIRDRPMQQVGKAGHYTLQHHGDPCVPSDAMDLLTDRQAEAYEAYESMLASGIAREVARQVLPVSIYSTCYVTMNVRALMNFLSLRNAPTALWEIRQVAARMEDDFAEAFPQTYQAFVDAGRVAP